MIIYEVNLDVDISISEEFRKWLDHHMSEVVRRGGFLGSQLFLVERSAEAIKWSAHYHVPTQAILDKYLAEQSPALREDGKKRFGDRFQASRRILRLDNSGALIEGRDYTFDSGLMVFTARYLQRRGYCCESGCRNCPY